MDRDEEKYFLGLLRRSSKKFTPGMSLGEARELGGLKIKVLGYIVKGGELDMSMDLWRVFWDRWTFERYRGIVLFLYFGRFWHFGGVIAGVWTCLYFFRYLVRRYL